MSIYIGNIVVDKKGSMYDQSLIKMINHRLKYVGDNSGVDKLLDYAGFSKYGKFAIQLDTDKEPYVIHVNYQGEISNTAQEHLEQLAKLVLACIDNCNVLEIKDAYGYEITINFD